MSKGPTASPIRITHQLWSNRESNPFLAGLDKYFNRSMDLFALY